MAGKIQKKYAAGTNSATRSDPSALDECAEKDSDSHTADLAAGLESPARQLQHYLGSELGQQFGEDVLTGRWSVRRTVGFVVLTCSLFWVIVWLALRAIF